MDMTETIVPNSEQVNAEDLLSGPRTVTIEAVERGNAEQPVFIRLKEFPGRTYRPNKSMRRVLVACWGPEASDYVGRRMTLYRDPTVKWAGQAVGGIAISAASDIDKPLKVALTVTRGKRKDFTVQPLETAPDPVQAWVQAINGCQTTDELAATWTEIQAARLSTNERLIRAKNDRKSYLSEPI